MLKEIIAKLVIILVYSLLLILTLAVFVLLFVVLPIKFLDILRGALW